MRAALNNIRGLICIILWQLTGIAVSHATDLNDSRSDYAAKVVTAFPVYRCKYAASAPKIDGRLDDNVWTKAEIMSQFRLSSGKATAQYKTEVRMLYDRDNLYIGFVAFDQDIWSSMREHDEPICEEEVVEVFIDEDSSGSGYIELEINCLNTIFDLYILPEGKATSKWNIKGLERAMTVDGTVNNSLDVDNSWSGEIRIPFINFVSAPRIPPQAGESWRINVYRIERNQTGDEYSAWSPTYTPTPNFHKPEWFGIVIFE